VESSPLFSVILPLHQGELYLEKTLQSVAGQREFDLTDLQLIVVNDGSTDRGPEILDPWASKLPLTRIDREEGSNWMAATNCGLRSATGEWISFLHQDDTWAPDRLSRLREEISRHPDVDFFAHPVRFIDSADRDVGRWAPPLPVNRDLDPRLALTRLASQNNLAIPAPCFRRSLLAPAEGLKEDLWFLADWDLWLRLLHASRSAFILPECLANFRIHDDSQTVQRSRDPEDLRAQFDAVYQRVESLCDGVHPRSNMARCNCLLTLAWFQRCHGIPVSWGPLFTEFLKLGPNSLARFPYETRLVQRLRPRLRK